ncbi:hypothetical protein K0040_12820 [Terrisporobacter petrolearius]|uniref:hypothetical protein n=1 Tax=Terrisporobacter petrolearius TaxID=1460447 RepID=UPI001D161795|nr:hypothetical protein [Terrisporobacter petrolearius]MCC3865155.1 hypothetical protein [Terrisporobacter petrolearius]
MDTRNIIDINKKEIYKQVKEMFKLNTTLELYKDFYKYINKENYLIIKDKKN